MASVPSRRPAKPARDRSLQGMEQLVEVIQELSLARTLDRVMAIVRTAARELTGADGATFVLRDGDLCYYAPWGNLAFFYADYRYSSGLIRLGRLDGGIEPLLRSGKFDLHIELLP